MATSTNNIHSQQLQHNHQPLNNRIDDTNNYSINYNSVDSKSSRAYASNYMLNGEHMLYQSDEEGDILEGTQTFQQLNQLNNRQELLQSLNDQGEVVYSHRSSNMTTSTTKKKENLLTESEVRTIIKDFNESLDKHSLEKVGLQRKIESLSDLINSQQQVVVRLTKDKENIIQQNEETLKKKEEAQVILNQYQNERHHSLSSPNESLDVNNDIAILISDKNNTQTQDTNYQCTNNEQSDLVKQHLTTKIKELEKRKLQMMTHNDQLRKEIFDKYEQNKLKEVKCQKCRHLFLPLMNQDDSCVYHPGKLKFYSCRGCGANQYYSCCNKCVQCQPGCKTQKHIA